MRVLIVDDEMLARAVVREYLGAHADIEIVGECANGHEAVQAITELAPDLVLLDIQMPRLDGFEVAELAGNQPRYIFTTAFDQYAIRAFEYHALDYLLKPFSQQRLDQALAHARASGAGIVGGSRAAGDAATARLVRDAARRKLPLDRVLIREGARVHIVACERIDYIEAHDDYVRIRADGRDYLKSQPLAELEGQLDGAHFLRIHRSCIVNLARIDRIEQATRDSHVAILKDGSRLPVSRSGYQKVRAALAPAAPGAAR
ncbi:LytR family transcriptional regulator [Duganella sp. Leaf126]|uniref:LytR/AlgR family response regulator transcription factor n=1 Tax=Duganella sp. Leaf126 TaxID=1736266 RepID=UPI0006F5EF7F|nr:LytTR family DNA-binding domain-containing protein [Duganella sp. Leaf126]KQQ45945.1 LytR family transcriptional regulator [Duganella sp. Leaf126]